MQNAEQILQAMRKMTMRGNRYPYQANEILESRMMRKYQVRFGGGTVEKCLQE